MNCAFCKGELVRGRVDHNVTLDETSILIKDVPANRCSTCEEYYVDTSIAIKLEKIILELRKDKLDVTIINFIEKE